MVLSQSAASGGVASNFRQLDGIQSYFALFSRSAQAGDTGVPVTLQAGGHPIGLSAAANGRLQAGPADLTAGFNAAVSDADALTTKAGMVISLKFTATSKGILTVYAPHLTYDVGDA
jgi:hypothetical protein